GSYRSVSPTVCATHLARAVRPLTDSDICPRFVGRLSDFLLRWIDGAGPRQRAVLMSAKTTRDHIVEAADRLFYRRGYEHTSFSDIADVVKISRGNFYFHFKTKDEILAAVINLRLANTRRMLEQWDSEGKEPAERIRSFIRILIANR